MEKLKTNEAILKELGITQFTAHHNFAYLYTSIQEAMNEAIIQAVKYTLERVLQEDGVKFKILSLEQEILSELTTMKELNLMEKKEVDEGNKLIAEFMNVNVEVEDGTTYYINAGTSCSTETLHYHSSWDWIMPVVEKIANIENQFEEPDEQDAFNVMRSSVVGGSIGFIKKETLWKAVIEFIKWHNQNK